jgi:hypothetical protein
MKPLTEKQEYFARAYVEIGNAPTGVPPACGDKLAANVCRSQWGGTG